MASMAEEADTPQAASAATGVMHTAEVRCVFHAAGSSSIWLRRCEGRMLRSWRRRQQATLHACDNATTMTISCTLAGVQVMAWMCQPGIDLLYYC